MAAAPEAFNNAKEVAELPPRRAAWRVAAVSGTVVAPCRKISPFVVAVELPVPLLLSIAIKPWAIKPIEKPAVSRPVRIVFFMRFCFVVFMFLLGFGC